MDEMDPNMDGAEGMDEDNISGDGAEQDDDLDGKQEYVKKESPFVFFGWPLGKHT